MSIVFDTVKNIIMVAYHDASAGTDADRGSIVTCDYFDDNATVGDAVYFGVVGTSAGAATGPFHDLTVNVGTQLVADAITVVWEYPKEGVWTTIPGVTDNTNAFQNAGSNTVSFAVPEDFSHTSTSFYLSNFPVNQRYIWIRCRLTAITNISEGGANVTDNITVKDHCITCSGETALTLAALDSADTTGGWNVVTKVGDNAYYIEASLNLQSNSDFTSTKEFLQLGTDKYRVTWKCYGATCSWQMGSKNSEGYGYNGSYMQYYSKYTSYCYMYNFSLFGSILWKDLGAWTSPIFYDLVDVRDSTMGGDYYYFSSGVDVTSYFHRSVWACSYFLYNYTGYIGYDKAYLPYATVSCDGALMGSGNARMDNTTFLDAQNIYRYYGCNITLVNCDIQDTNWTTEGAGYAFKLNNSPSGTSDLHVKVYYTFDLTVVDEAGDPIQGARVTLVDGQGNTVIEPTLSGDEFSDTIFNALFANLMNWAEPPDYNSGMIGGTVTMTSGTYNGRKATVTHGGTTSWSGPAYSYFVISPTIAETSATFDFEKWNSGVTDSNGQVAQEECIVWDAYIDYSDSWSRQNVDHKDYVLNITASGYEPYEYKWNFRNSQQVDLKITLKTVRCNSQHKSVAQY